jgi:hypothetical protein
MSQHSPRSDVTVNNTLPAIPDSWLPVRLKGGGFLPDVGVHRRGAKVIQETSRWVWIQVGVMFTLAALALYPAAGFGLDIPYYVQLLVALGFAWGAICLMFGASWIQRKLGQTVTVDLEKQTVTVARADERIAIPAAAVLGLQILRAPPEEGGYQLNLVFRGGSGSIERCNLTANAIRYYVVRVATAYQRALGWPMMSGEN